MRTARRSSSTCRRKRTSASLRGIAEAPVRAAADALIGADPLELSWQTLPLIPDMSALHVGWTAPDYLPNRSSE